MCCNTVMYEALSSITAWMDQHAVEYVVLDGTLLGAARDKDVIPWTADLDIGISAKDVPKLIHQKDIPFHFAYKQEIVIPRGCEAHNPGFPGNYSNSTPSLHTLAYGDEAQTGQGSYYIDIYPFETFSEFYKDFDSGCLERNRDGTIRNTTVQIRDRKFKAPANIEACLVEWYGKDWRIPTHKQWTDVVVAESEATAKTDKVLRVTEKQGDDNSMKVQDTQKTAFKKIADHTEATPPKPKARRNTEKKHQAKIIEKAFEKIASTPGASAGKPKAMPELSPLPPPKPPPAVTTAAAEAAAAAAAAKATQDKSENLRIGQPVGSYISQSQHHHAKNSIRNQKPSISTPSSTGNAVHAVTYDGNMLAKLQALQSEIQKKNSVGSQDVDLFKGMNVISEKI